MNLWKEAWRQTTNKLTTTRSTQGVCLQIKILERKRIFGVIIAAIKNKTCLQIGKAVYHGVCF